MGDEELEERPAGGKAMAEREKVLAREPGSAGRARLAAARRCGLRTGLRDCRTLSGGAGEAERGRCARFGRQTPCICTLPREACSPGLA